MHGRVCVAFDATGRRAGIRCGTCRAPRDGERNPFSAERTAHPAPIYGTGSETGSDPKSLLNNVRMTWPAEKFSQVKARDKPRMRRT